MSFWNHQDSKTYAETKEAVMTLPNTTATLHKPLSETQKQIKKNSMFILSSIRFLAAKEDWLLD